MYIRVNLIPETSPLAGAVVYILFGPLRLVGQSSCLNGKVVSCVHTVADCVNQRVSYVVKECE